VPFEYDHLVIRPLLLPLILAVVIALTSASTHASTAETTITISGGNLPHSVDLAAADVDSFMRRINTPPRLDDKPAGATGSTYTLSSQYWSNILSRPGRASVDADATYFPEGGIVRAEQGGKDAWLVLDIRQRAILARYIRLTLNGSLDQRPGLLKVLTSAANDEEITVEANGGPIGSQQVGPLWAGLANTGTPQFLNPPEPPDVGMTGYWVVFGLDEGRSLQMYYQAGTPGKLTDALGDERYTVSTQLASVLDSVKATPHNINDPSTGSYAWWIVGLGLGIVCLAGAVLFSRHRFPLPRQLEALIDRYSPHDYSG